MSLKKCGVTGNFAGGIFHLEGRLLKEWLQPFDPFMMVKNIQQWSKLQYFGHWTFSELQTMGKGLKHGNNQFSWDSGVDLNSSSSSESQVEPCRLPRESFSHKLYFIFKLFYFNKDCIFIYIYIYNILFD